MKPFKVIAELSYMEMHTSMDLEKSWHMAVARALFKEGIRGEVKITSHDRLAQINDRERMLIKGTYERPHRPRHAPVVRKYRRIVTTGGYVW